MKRHNIAYKKYLLLWVLVFALGGLIYAQGQGKMAKFSPPKLRQEVVSGEVQAEPAGNQQGIITAGKEEEHENADGPKIPKLHGAPSYKTVVKRTARANPKFN